MMSTTGLLCLVAALVSTVSCSTCINCININGAECDCEETMMCPNGCATFSEYCVADNRPMQSMEKGCAPHGLTETVTLAFNDAGRLLEHLHINVCEGNHCNKETKFRHDPADLGLLNGLYCESCSRENAKEKECKSCERVACRGDQHQCLSLSGTFERGDGTVLHYVTKGCVSDLICNMTYSFLPWTKIWKEITFNCTKASTSARDCSGCGGNSYY